MNRSGARRSHGTARPGRAERLLAALEQVLSADELHTGDLPRALHRRDHSFFHGQPLAVAVPRTREALLAVVRACARYEVPFAPRGAGTGVAGGAVAVGDACPPLVVVTTRLDAVLSIDPASRTAWVQPGVVNADLDRAAGGYHLRYAPDPSSQAACTIGGNVATNAGGAHCLKYGVTSNHVLAVELIHPDGTIATYASSLADQSGLDVRGVLVGSEGTAGIVASAQVRLLPRPPQTTTMLAGLPSVAVAAQAVSDLVREPVLPAALELMDTNAVRLVEAYAPCGYPVDAGAVLLVEFEGDDEVHAAVEAARRVLNHHGATTIRQAATAQERRTLWHGRKSAAGALAKLAPDYYLHDCVVPRSRLAEVVRRIDEIAAHYRLRVVSMHHAGDGNLHPLLPFDRSDPDELQRVLKAGREIVTLALELGGALSGEHGIGIEKRDLMCQALSPASLDLQRRVKAALDPTGLANPHKVLPTPKTCGDLPLSLVPEGAWI